MLPSEYFLNGFFHKNVLEKRAVKAVRVFSMVNVIYQVILKNFQKVFMFSLFAHCHVLSCFEFCFSCQRPHMIVLRAETNCLSTSNNQSLFLYVLPLLTQSTFCGGKRRIKACQIRSLGWRLGGVGKAPKRLEKAWVNCKAVQWKAWWSCFS